MNASQGCYCSGCGQWITSPHACPGPRRVEEEIVLQGHINGVQSELTRRALFQFDNQQGIQRIASRVPEGSAFLAQAGNV